MSILDVVLAGLVGFLSGIAAAVATFLIVSIVVGSAAIGIAGAVAAFLAVGISVAKLAGPLMRIAVRIAVVLAAIAGVVWLVDRFLV